MHWYKRDGKPAYEIEDTKGKLRATTLRDARKHGYGYSVTEIIGCQDKPALRTWLQQQLLNAVIANPYNPDVWFDEKLWRNHVLHESQNVGREARQKGTAIHDALEGYYKGEGLALDMHDICTPVIDFMEQRFPGVEWISESSFYHSAGFGGKVDLHSKTHNIVLDFKTTDKADASKMVAYSDHHMQTAAYAHGLELDITKVLRYNLFISTSTPGVMKLTESKDVEKDWQMFTHLLNFVKLRNNYDPENYSNT